MENNEVIEGNKLIAEFMELGYKVFYNGLILGKNGYPLRLGKNRNGYVQVNIYKNGKYKTYLVHRLVAIHHVPNMHNLKEVNHIDGDKTNNDFRNLEWCDRSHNIKHAVQKGLISIHMKGKTGSKHQRSKSVLMTDADNTLIAEYGSTHEAARKTGYNAKSIQDACKGRLKTYKKHKWSYKTTNLK